ncbi:hypothetical protein [Streptomyces profundus]|uniref:hypothetical protein n=1 Tax=Streptomyces profundus TaxID=2867410 RepID=UPI001D167D4E|nr:hypothetical protein [Streptomyces sp. MA3_2.13]UED88813.1 hypothetical protein K4G22_14690 [Streptomyces sp. MA3_2.13]
MRSFIGDQEIATEYEMTELAIGLGTDPELWLGSEGESEEERAARLDAAADILADDPELAGPVARLTALAIAEYLAMPEIVRAVTR